MATASQISTLARELAQIEAACRLVCSRVELLQKFAGKLDVFAQQKRHLHAEAIQQYDAASVQQAYLEQASEIIDAELMQQLQPLLSGIAEMHSAVPSTPEPPGS